MRFLSPQVLWLLPPFLALFSLILLMLASRKGKYVRQFSEFMHVRFSMLTLVLVNIVLASLIISWAQPEIRYDKKIYKSMDMVFLADVSLSTFAEDEILQGISLKTVTEDETLPERKINRCDVIRDELVNAILDFRDERAGLVVFAGKAFPLAAITRDYRTLLGYVRWLSPDWVANRGTNIKHALEVGLGMFAPESDEKKVLVLLTDGGEEARKIPGHEEQMRKIFRKAAKIREAGISFYVLGVGGETRVKIPNHAAGEGVYFKDYDRTSGVQFFLETRLDIDTLETIAEKGGGTYQRYDHPGQLVEMLAKEKAEKVLDHVEEGWKDASWMFLLVALGFSLLAAPMKRTSIQQEEN